MNWFVPAFKIARKPESTERRLAISALTRFFKFSFIAIFFAAFLPGCENNPAGSRGLAKSETAGKPSAIPVVRLQRAFGGLSFTKPVAVLQAPGDGSRWFVVEQAGRVLTFANDDAVIAADTFIDIRNRVNSEPNEAGLLGMAFHPDFRKNRRFFLSYTRTGSPLVSHISGFTADSGGEKADAGSEQTVLTVNQPYGNHNGGDIEFGPDGYLYIAFGDGGGGGDPHANGQNLQTLLGAILRIDVDSAAPYAIPLDNPFVQKGARAEIYAYGLRNPWRFSFDRVTGKLWAADVGQDKWEEINRIEKGKNYGWNFKEGFHCYEIVGCGAMGLTEPVAEYSHEDGCSVTGGYVYRGTKIERLKSVYLYGDYCSGKIWGLFAIDKGFPPPVKLLDSGLRISSFGQGADGELYVVDHQDGGIYRIIGDAG